MKKAASQRAMLPQLEALESRLFLDASPAVTVSVVAHTLYIIGDRDAYSYDQISISQTGKGAYDIFGMGSTLVGKGGENLDSQSVTGVTRNIVIDMPAGCGSVELGSDLHVGDVDPVTLQGARGSISIRGADYVFLGGTPVTARVSISANPADGDTIQFTNALGAVQTLELGNGVLHNPNNIRVPIGRDESGTTRNFIAAVNKYLTNLVMIQPHYTGPNPGDCYLTWFAGTAGNQPIVASSANIYVDQVTRGADYSLDAQNVTIEMGNPNSYPSVLSLGTLSATPDVYASAIHGSLSVIGGRGDDVVAIGNASIHGNFTAKLGVGNNRLAFISTAGSYGQNLGWVGGNMTYYGGATGDNDLVFSSAAMGSALAVITGAGNDTVDLGGAQVAGNATLNLGAGNDTVDMSGVQAARNVTLNLGTGNNDFMSYGATAANFGGNVRFTTVGSGTNTFGIESTAGPSNIAGGLTIRTGAGFNTIGFDANVAGNLFVNSGGSQSEDMVGGDGGTVRGTATIRTGKAGSDDFVSSTIDLENMTFIRGIAISAGAGSHQVMIAGCEFCRHDGSFSFNGGVGSDTFFINAYTGSTRPSTFWGGVNIKLGAAAGIGSLTIGASPATGGAGDAYSYARFLSTVSAPVFNCGTGNNIVVYYLDAALRYIPNQFLLSPVVIPGIRGRIL